jgi:hypothetical protein
LTPLIPNAFGTGLARNETGQFQCKTKQLKLIELIAKGKLVEIASSLRSCKDCKDAICHCEPSEAIPLLNACASTSIGTLFCLKKHYERAT